MTTDDIMELSIEIDAGLRAKLRTAIAALEAERDALTLQVAALTTLYESAEKIIDQLHGQRDALRQELKLIAEQEPIELILDPQWAARIALHALKEQK